MFSCWIRNFLNYLKGSLSSSWPSNICIWSLFTSQCLKNIFSFLTILKNVCEINLHRNSPNKSQESKNKSRTQSSCKESVPCELHENMQIIVYLMDSMLHLRSTQIVWNGIVVEQLRDECMVANDSFIFTFGVMGWSFFKWNSDFKSLSNTAPRKINI